MIERSISFTVFGKPMPKGSKTAVVRGNHAVLLDARRGPARAAYTAWKEAVSSQAYAALLMIDKNMIPFPFPFLDGPIDVRLNFFLPRPKSLPKKELLHIKKPDLDKLVRAAIDPMTGILFRDDSQIVRFVARKDYGEPRVEVTIKSWEKGSE